MRASGRAPVYLDSGPHGLAIDTKRAFAGRRGRDSKTDRGGGNVGANSEQHIWIDLYTLLGRSNGLAAHRMG